MSQLEPPKEVDEEQYEDGDEGDEGDEGDDEIAPSDQFGAMLNAILGSYFEYQAGDGSTLNIADILLLIRQSLDANTAALQALAAAKK